MGRRAWRLWGWRQRGGQAGKGEGGDRNQSGPSQISGVTAGVGGAASHCDAGSALSACWLSSGGGVAVTLLLLLVWWGWTEDGEQEGRRR